MSNIVTFLSYLGRKKASDVIISSASVTYDVLTNFGSAVCGISGGSDSDVMLDLVWNVNKYAKADVDYLWFDTGLEYQATKDHLSYLEDRYGISIIRERAIKSVPLCCKQYGIPFRSKLVSNRICALQKLGFDFSTPDVPGNKSTYAKNWWENKYSNFDRNMLNISWNPYLKEFMMANPPTFQISQECCHYAKKAVAERYMKKSGKYLNIIGVRKEEGGIRSKAQVSYINGIGQMTCKTIQASYGSKFQPLFLYKNSDKELYCKIQEIAHSRCYTEYGLLRTGCVGCPFSLYLKSKGIDVEAASKYEPGLYKAMMNVFGSSYEYTQQYYEFRSEYPKLQALKYLIRHPLLKSKNATE